MFQRFLGLQKAFSAKWLSRKYGALFVSTRREKERIVHARTTSNEAVVLAYDRYEPKADKPNATSTPLVVIHGLFGSKKNWSSFCKTYNKMTGREIITVDCRNHGESVHTSEMSCTLMSRDVKETLRQLNIGPKAIVIGHSMGGKVAMHMTLAMPNEVEKLVVVDVIPASPSVEQLREFQGLIQAMLNVDLSQVKTRKDADEILAMSIPVAYLRGFLLTNLRRDEEGKFTWQFNLKGLQQNMERLAENDLNGMPRYEGEVLFIAGGDSKSVKPRDLRAIREKFPKASLKVIPGAGHDVHVDKPKDFLEILDRFLTPSTEARLGLTKVLI